MQTNLKCIAVDDDELFLRSYEVIFHEYEWLDLMDVYCQPVKAATAIIQTRPDVIFLDLEMPHIEGDDLLEWLSPKLKHLDYQPKVIMVSSYVELESINHPLIEGYINKQDFIHSDQLEANLKRILRIV